MNVIRVFSGTCVIAGLIAGCHKAPPGDEHMAHMRRSFQIVADGQPFPPHLAEHQVSAITPDGMIAWHVLENHCPHTTRPDGVPERVPGLCDGCGVRLTRHPSWGWIPA